MAHTNNCVGEKNYWLLFTLSYISIPGHRPAEHNLILAPVETQASDILGLVALVSVMGLIMILLIGQLLCFHIYLLWNKLSTYEYIMHQRQKQEVKSTCRDMEPAGTPPTRMSSE
ncbi:unnamed protein product [Ranitomeya imitator]|uniref:Protein S-acyltransferase n=1 Tax=Ranitomeya imitator TaxID=111125 RepID=A0ABN9MIW4_9NEOB|nr:unnamed protein product [Ranitomeya imitator]